MQTVNTNGLGIHQALVMGHTRIVQWLWAHHRAALGSLDRKADVRITLYNAECSNDVLNHNVIV